MQNLNRHKPHRISGTSGSLPASETEVMGDRVMGNRENEN
jgi:hypothetical protein